MEFYPMPIRRSGSPVRISPFRCRVWALHNRLEDALNEKNCAEEIESIRIHGQQVPAIARPVRNDPDYDAEIIVGALRLYAASVLKIDLLVEFCDLTDKEAIIVMHVYSLQKELSPYEKGCAYRAWLNSRNFASQEELAGALGITRQSLARCMKLASLPSVIVRALGNGTEILESWGVKLAEVLTDPTTKRAVLREARRLNDCPQPLHIAYKRLLAAAAPTSRGGRKARIEPQDRVVDDADGTPLFRVRTLQDAVSIIIPLKRASRRQLEEIERLILHCLGGEKFQAQPQSRDFKASLQILRT